MPRLWTSCSSIESLSIEQTGIGDRVRKLGKLRLVPVGQDDDRRSFRGIPNDARAEASRRSAMPNLSRASVFSNVPPVPITRPWMIGFRTWRENLIERFLFHQLSRHEGRIPFAQIRYGGINAAIAQNRAGEALIRPLERGTLGRITTSSILNKRRPLLIGQGPFHFQGLENVLFQKVRKGLSRPRLYNRRQQRVSRVAVTKFCSWWKIRFVLWQEQTKHVPVKHRDCRSVGNHVLIVDQAGRVG